VRTGRELQATPKGISLLTLLRGIGIPELCSPELTGDWEFKLKQMEQGQLMRPEFMAEIAGMTRHIVDTVRKYESDTVPGDFAVLRTPCPKCGGEIRENYRKFQCAREGCDFALWRIAAGRQFEAEEIEELLTKGKIGPLQGFRSKMGRPFAAIIKMGPEFKPEFDFGQSGTDANGVAEDVDFSGQESIGKCPVCGGRVFEHGMNYVCEKSVGKERSCTFRTGKIILQRPIERDQIRRLLETKKTDLLHKFISKKGRPFSAFLVVGEQGKVGFEFAPRAPKPGAKAGAGARRAPTTTAAGTADAAATAPASTKPNEGVKAAKPAVPRKKPAARPGGDSPPRG
jgi:DNA topoisomerase-3